MSWEWIGALVVGGVLGVGARWFWRLFRALVPGSAPSEVDLAKKVYLEPTRAKEILRDLDKKKEQTLSEIDRGYADRRRELLSYLEGQREQIIRDLNRKRTTTHPPDPGPPPDSPKS